MLKYSLIIVLIVIVAFTSSLIIRNVFFDTSKIDTTIDEAILAYSNTDFLTARRIASQHLDEPAGRLVYHLCQLYDKENQDINKALAGLKEIYEDHTTLLGEAVRTKRWDSCFTMDFTHVHGGSIRPELSDRYRQWLTHKLAHWHDQFDTSGCVGCGRCVVWCPAGIDIVDEALKAAKNGDPNCA